VVTKVITRESIRIKRLQTSRTIFQKEVFIMVKEKNKDKTKGVDEEDVTVVDRDVAKKAVFATAMGNAMEWFDFGIYSYLVATLSKIFFAGVADEYQLILGFGTFTAAF